jgi:hypothetical protein
MLSNNQNRAECIILIIDGDENEDIRLTAEQKKAVRRSSKYLRREFDNHREADDKIKLKIPEEDRKQQNFAIATVRIFFDIFKSKSIPELDCDTLANLCHVFRWLECDSKKIAHRKDVLNLRRKLLSASSWRFPETESCAHLIIIGLVLRWRQELTHGCNDIIYNSVARGDSDLWEKLPSINGM